MASELRPDTVRKKLLATESLDDFLDRMVLVWVDRQRRLAEAPARAVGAERRYTDKKRAADPEAYLQARRDAVARYARRHPDRVKETRRRRARLQAEQKAERRAQQQLHRSADLVERDAKRMDRPEGYPKGQAKPPGRGASTLRAEPVERQDDLSRAWFTPAEAAGSRHEGR